MARFPDVPGLNVTINVNGEPLVEYEDDNIDETLQDEAAPLRAKAISKYVTSVTDQEFTIDLTVGAEYITTSPSLTFRLSVDGEWISSPILTQSYFWVGRDQKRTIIGPESYDAYTQKGFVHHMKFAGIKTTVDESKQSNIKNDQKKMSKVGTIVVKVYRTSLPTDVEPSEQQHTLGNGSSSEVHEKALKGQAKSHGVLTTRATEIAVLRSTINYLDGRDSPIAVFYFHYRSMEALKQLCIISRTPERDIPPTPSPAVKVTASQRHIKRERANDENIKLESGQRASKRRKSKYKVTIDLTNDSDSDADSVVSVH